MTSAPMPFAGRALKPSLSQVTAAILIAGLWLATRRYEGLFHDSRLYTLQAMARLWPDRLAVDLFLVFGSQDRFTLFSPLYGLFLRGFGVADGNIALLLIGGGLWLIGLTALGRVWMGGWRPALIGSVVMIAVPLGISFRVGENFLTPRLLAEGLVMLGLAMMLCGRVLTAVVTMVAAAAIHPLTALPGMAIFFLHESQRRRWLWAVAAIFVTAGSAAMLAGVEPFARLAQRFDPPWFSIVNVRNNYCLISNWTVGQWFEAANIFGAALPGLIFGPAPLRRLLATAFFVGGAGIGLAFVGGDLLHNVLLTDIQPWRWSWPLAVLSLFCAAAVVMAPFQASESDSSDRPQYLVALSTAIALIFLGLSRYYPISGLFAAPMLVFGCSVALAVGRHRSPAATRWAGTGIAVVAATLLGAIASNPPSASRDIIVPISETLTSIAIVAALLVAFTALVTIDTAKMRKPMLLASVALFTLTIARWDARSPWQHFIATGPMPPAALAALLPANGQIYWEGDVTVPWLMLRRASYFSCEQGAGVLFTRQTAIAWQRRGNSLMPLRPLDFQRFSFCPQRGNTTPKPRLVSELATICRRETGLSALVLVRPVVNGRGQEWRAPVPFEIMVFDGKAERPFRTDRFYIYNCADYR